MPTNEEIEGRLTPTVIATDPLLNDLLIYASNLRKTALAATPADDREAGRLEGQRQVAHQLAALVIHHLLERL